MLTYPYFYGKNAAIFQDRIAAVIFSILKFLVTVMTDCRDSVVNIVTDSVAVSTCLNC